MSGQIHKYSFPLYRGLNIKDPPHRIADGGAQRLENFDIDNEWKKRQGTRRYNKSVVGDPTLGVPTVVTLHGPGYPLEATDRTVIYDANKFENPNFIVGDLDGQDGWVAGDSDAAIGLVDGDQRLQYGTGIVTSNRSFVFSEPVDSDKEVYLDLEKITQAGADAMTIYISPAAGWTSYMFSLKLSGTSWRLDYGSGLFATSSWPVGARKEVKFVITDGGDFFDFYIGDLTTTVYTGLATNNSGPFAKVDINETGGGGGLIEVDVHNLTVTEFVPVPVPSVSIVPRGTLCFYGERTNGGADWLVANSTGVLNRIDFLSKNQPQFVHLASGLGDQKMQAAQFKDTTYIVSQGFNPKYWDGTTLGDVPNLTDGDLFRASHIRAWNNRLIFADIREGDTRIRSQMIWTDANPDDITVITVNATSFAPVPSHKPITCLWPIDDDMLLVFTRNECYTMTIGELPEIHRTNAAGCVGPNAICQAETLAGRRFFYLSPQGPQEYIHGASVSIGENWENVRSPRSGQADAVVTWTNSKKRALFVLPEAAGGNNGYSRTFAYYPDKGTQFDTQWSELHGMPGDMVAADSGISDLSDEATLYIDRFGHVNEMDFGEKDEGFNLMLESQSAYTPRDPIFGNIANFGKFDVNVPAGYAITENGLVGLYVLKYNPADPKMLFQLKVITANEAGTAGQTINCTVDTGWNQIYDGHVTYGTDYFYIGAFWSIAETKAYDFGRPNYMKRFISVDMNQNPLASSPGIGMGLLIRPDFLGNIGNNPLGDEGNYGGLAAVVDGDGNAAGVWPFTPGTTLTGPMRSMDRVRYHTGAKGGRYASVMFWHLSIDGTVTPARYVSETFRISDVFIQARLYEGQGKR